MTQMIRWMFPRNTVGTTTPMEAKWGSETLEAGALHTYWEEASDQPKYLSQLVTKIPRYVLRESRTQCNKRNSNRIKNKYKLVKIARTAGHRTVCPRGSNYLTVTIWPPRTMSCESDGSRLSTGQKLRKHSENMFLVGFHPDGWTIWGWVPNCPPLTRQHELKGDSKWFSPDLFPQPMELAQTLWRVFEEG